MRLEHLTYLTDRSYRRARHAEMLRLAKTKGVDRLTVVHEDDGSCCELEPWALTFVRVIEATNADGLKTAGVVLG